MPDEPPTEHPGVISLRPVGPDDLAALFHFQLDPESNRVAVTNPRDREAFDALWENILNDQSNLARAILLDNTLIGHISCFRSDGLDTVGYWIARRYWGRGIATRALELLLDEIPLRPLHARAATTNLGSLRVLERSGFTVTGYRICPATERYPACREALLVLE